MTGTERDRNDGERQRLLRRESQLDAGEGGDSRGLVLIEFEEDDQDNPREWNYSEKLTNVSVIASSKYLLGRKVHLRHMLILSVTISGYLIAISIVHVHAGYQSNRGGLGFDPRTSNRMYYWVCDNARDRSIDTSTFV